MRIGAPPGGGRVWRAQRESMRGPPSRPRVLAAPTRLPPPHGWGAHVHPRRAEGTLGGPGPQRRAGQPPRTVTYLCVYIHRDTGLSAPRLPGLRPGGLRSGGPGRGGGVLPAGRGRTASGRVEGPPGCERQLVLLTPGTPPGFCSRGGSWPRECSRPPPPPPQPCEGPLPAGAQCPAGPPREQAPRPKGARATAVSSCGRRRS